MIVSRPGQRILAIPGDGVRVVQPRGGAAPAFPLVIRHETGLSEYDSVVDGGGDLSQSADAALAGTSGGLLVLVNDTASIYGEKAISLSADKLRLRIYFDPNSLTMANNDSFAFLQVKGAVSTVLSLHFLYQSGYKLQVYFVQDGNNWSKTFSPSITDAPHYVEIYMVRESADGWNDGTGQMWIDGASAGTSSGIGNYNCFNAINRIAVGAVGGIDAGTSGTFYLDELVVRDDDVAIGPV